ncbi:T9SS type B sorting domain-containing protein [Maribacter algicola]|uniref:T9SS type B sorting domain-containing protein n=1 Tax=Meishania litoralis TaxID=3434685 RepID=A0ACC7LFQ0_9FLAO
MEKKGLFIGLLFLGLVSYGQNCPRIQSPSNGSVGVPVNTTITWNQVSGIDGYLISLGTTPGGTDILNRRSAGLVNSFTPELGLPDDTLIYVTISLFVTDGQLVECPGETFSTEDVVNPPNCTQLANDQESESDSGKVHWLYAPTATGYRITIGTAPGATDVADDIDVGNALSYRPENGLPLDQELFIKVVPYNENGEATNCSAQNMTYSEPVLDCTPFVPLLGIPDRIGICPDGTMAVDPYQALGASGFRWFKKNNDNTETLLSDNEVFFPSEPGEYRFEVFNIINENGVGIECSNSREITVLFSEAPVIESVHIERRPIGLEIEVRVNGTGEYEYALDNENGPYQPTPVFQGVKDGQHIVFVRDANGCGMDNRVIELDLSPKNFPAFFTPNQDGINDFWQFIPAPESGEINVEYIRIYDRYGNFLKQLDPNSQGWDGSFKGRRLPESDYWYLAASFNGQQLKGHFTLKR